MGQALRVPVEAPHVDPLVRAAFRVQGSGFMVQGSGIKVQGSGFRVQGSGFIVQGTGFRVHPKELQGYLAHKEPPPS